MTFSSRIFDSIANSTISDCIDNALNSLEVLNDCSFIFDTKKCDDFYRLIREISQKTSVEQSDSVQVEYLQTAKWALQLWNESLKTENFSRMLISYLILVYLKYPIDRLKIEWGAEKRKNISLKVANGFQFNIGVPGNADYSHQSMFKEYREGVDSKNLNRLLAFFSTLERGIGISGRNSTPPKSIELIYLIHKAGILLLLGRGEPVLAELVLHSLQPDDVTEILANDFNEEHDFPLARGLAILSSYYWEQLNQKNLIVIPYNRLGAILEKLKKQPTWDTTFKELINTGVLKYNPVFHYCCGLCAADSPEFIEQYFENVDFSKEEFDYGNSFCQALLTSADDEMILRASEMFIEKYRAYLSHYNGQFVLNRATSYFNFVIFYVDHKSKTTEGYCALLAEQFQRVDNARNSWFPNDTYAEAQFLYLIVAANFSLNYAIPVDAPVVKNIGRFILDERHSGLLSNVPANMMIELLTDPLSLECLTMHHENGSVSEFRRNDNPEGER